MLQSIEVSTGGRLKVTPTHGAGEVVPGLKELDGIHEGVLDLASTCTMYWMDRFGPACNLFTYQIGGLSPTEQWMWSQDEGMEFLKEMTADYNVKFIEEAAYLCPPEAFLGTKPPLTKPEDLKGLKLRTAGDDGVVFTQMGASVSLLSPAEVYESIMRGVLDGYQLSSPGYDYSQAMYEVVDYLYLGPSRQPCEWFPIMVNPDSWAELPDDMKAILIAEFHRWGYEHYRMRMAEDLVAVPAFREKGVTVDFIPKSIEDEVVSRAMAIYAERSAKDPFFNRVYTSIENFKTAYRDAWQRL
jgi:TRAP-type mannitol/chloroaromatic compound transport system substrate-binding protein